MILESSAGLLAFFGAMLGLLELGRRIGRRSHAIDPAAAGAGLGTIESAVLALLGLLIAFTFSGANSRLETRRNLIVQEANAIGTAWLRLDLLPAETRIALQGDFRRYVEARLAVTRHESPETAAAWEPLQAEIWTRAVEASRSRELEPAARLLLPALNDMFDVANARSLAMHTHAPTVVFVMLVALALVCALLAGYGMAANQQRSWLHILCFTGTLLLVVYVIWDVEFPRDGLIRVDKADQLLLALRSMMK